MYSSIVLNTFSQSILSRRILQEVIKTLIRVQGLISTGSRVFKHSASREQEIVVNHSNLNIENLHKRQDNIIKKIKLIIINKTDRNCH